jgi:PilZ domain
MDRRKQPRVEVHQEVTVTVLGDPDWPSFRAVAVDMSGSGMRLLSPLPVPYQAAVKIEVEALLLLGEVIHIEHGAQGHTLGVKLQHSLAMFEDLYRLNDALRRESFKAVEKPV